MRRLHAIFVFVVLFYSDSFSQPWEKLREQASVLYSQGKPDSAIIVATKAVDTAIALLGEMDTTTSWQMHWLANYYLFIGNTAEAERWYRKSLEIREKTVGPHHYLIAHELNTIGNLYWQHLDFAEAERTYRKALAILEPWGEQAGYYRSKILLNLGVCPSNRFFQNS
jgi:tetratricopeptide (TPR) repeat protein